MVTVLILSLRAFRIFSVSLKLNTLSPYLVPKLYFIELSVIFWRGCFKVGLEYCIGVYGDLRC